MRFIAQPDSSPPGRSQVYESAVERCTPGVPLLALSEYARRLLPLMDRKIAGEIMLRSDPLHSKVPKYRLNDALHFAIESGIASARSLISRFETNDPYRLSERLGIAVRRTRESSLRGTQVYHSEYYSRPPTILLYEESIAELEGIIDRCSLRDTLTPVPIAAAFLAHEVYHHLEIHDKTNLVSKFRVPVLSLGPFKIWSGLMTLSEIAADVFSETILSLNYTLRFLQQLTIYHHNPALGIRVFDLMGSQN